MYVLDSDVLTLYFAGKEPLVSRAQRESGAAQICLTIVNRVEVLRGRFDYLLKAQDASHLIRAQQLLTATEAFLKQFPVLTMDEQAEQVFSKLSPLRSLRKHGRADLLIASIVIANKGTLVTRNVKDFKNFPQLELANWLE